MKSKLCGFVLSLAVLLMGLLQVDAGSETRLLSAGTVADTCYATGDFDGNGVAPTVADYVFALRVMLGSEPPPANLYEFDLNGDCVVDTADAFVLSCYFTYGVSCFRSPFPVPTCCSPTLVTYTCPVPITGDVNGDGAITTADIVRAVCLAFRCDLFPCENAAADVNCSGTFTVADIIYLVNFLFRGGDPPCDVCPLLLDGPWEGACLF